MCCWVVQFSALASQSLGESVERGRLMKIEIVKIKSNSLIREAPGLHIKTDAACVGLSLMCVAWSWFPSKRLDSRSYSRRLQHRKHFNYRGRPNPAPPIRRKYNIKPISGPPIRINKLWYYMCRVATWSSTIYNHKEGASLFRPSFGCLSQFWFLNLFQPKRVKTSLSRDIFTLVKTNIQRSC